MCLAYEDLSRQIKELETERNAAANRLKSYLKEAETGIAGDYRVTWKQVTRNSFDSRRLKAEQPELYESFLTQSSYRRLSVA